MLTLTLPRINKIAQSAAAALFTLFVAGAALAQTAPTVVPTALPGPVNEGDFVILDADGSFDTNTPPSPLTFSWQQISGPTAQQFAFQTTELALVVPFVGGTGGILTFQVTVTNGFALSSSANITVQIKAANRPPVASIVQPTQPYLEGSTVTLDGSATFDPDGDPLSYNWIQTSGPSVALISQNSPTPSFASLVTGTPTTYGFELLVNDGQQTTTAVVTLQTVPAHHPPIANAGVTETVGYRDVVTLDGSGSTDPDGNVISYSWAQTAGPAVILDLTNPSKPTFTAPSKTAPLTFSLTVQDAYLTSTPATVTINVFPPDAIPNCETAHANKTQIWPPDQTFARVKIRGLETDPKVRCDDNSSDDGEGRADADDDNEDNFRNQVKVTSITQDEPTSGVFKGDLSPDAVVQTTRPNHKQRVRDLIMVRRELNPKGDGRVYKINFTVTNTLSQATCQGSVIVCVPTKRGAKGICVDSGQNYNSFQQ